MDFKEIACVVYLVLFVLAVWRKCAGLPGLFEGLLYMAEDEEEYIITLIITKG